MSSLEVVWIDGGREPVAKPNPAYPNGIDLGYAAPGQMSCRTDLPYPARRCGKYFIKCMICGMTLLATTAGRRDDPRSVTIPCKPMARA
jgi:hypothetical protein